jgi:toxin ParE1/3/4
MAQIELVPEVLDDFDRILDHLVTHGVRNAAERVQDIVSAIDVLARNPLIGRPAAQGRRELVIGQHARGDVALYVYAESVDTVFVLAVRGQKEAGYAR